MTGIIIALSRAIGETAPLITIGALTFIAFLPPPPVQTQPPFVSARVVVVALRRAADTDVQLGVAPRAGIRCQRGRRRARADHRHIVAERRCDLHPLPGAKAHQVVKGSR